MLFIRTSHLNQLWLFLEQPLQPSEVPWWRFWGTAFLSSLQEPLQNLKQEHSIQEYFTNSMSAFKFYIGKYCIIFVTGTLKCASRSIYQPLIRSENCNLHHSTHSFHMCSLQPGIYIVYVRTVLGMSYQFSHMVMDLPPKLINKIPSVSYSCLPSLPLCTTSYNPM
jgi:hypothetical protein